jgi:hypothetical protein
VKIALIAIGELKYTPYAARYIQAIKEKGMAYDLIFWNRSAKALDTPPNHIHYDGYSALDKPLRGKLPDFWRYGRWLRRLVGEKGYGKLIILSTLSGILLYGPLMRKYDKRFIFDIRDYSYEHVPPFFRMERRLIDAAYFTCISSPGFREFLPERDYVMAHNFNRSDLPRKRPFKKKAGGALNLAYNGVIMYFDHQSRIIERLGNDGRFRLFFHGDGPEADRYRDFCAGRGYGNVFFTGAYDNSERASLLRDADILNNSYGSAKKASKIRFAVSNKFYDGAIFGIPQLVETGSFKSELCREKRLGIALDARDEGFADKLIAYYEGIGAEAFNAAREAFLAEILREDADYLDRIGEFLEA